MCSVLSVNTQSFNGNDFPHSQPLMAFRYVYTLFEGGWSGVSLISTLGNFLGYSTQDNKLLRIKNFHIPLSAKNQSMKNGIFSKISREKYKKEDKDEDDGKGENCFTL